MTRWWTSSTSWPWQPGGGRRVEAANRHFADVDILHNLHTPRHWGDGIAFGHSYHDEEGFDNPRHNYGGSHPDTVYGESGLLTTYYLTGYEKAYATTLELADCTKGRGRNKMSHFVRPGLPNPGP